MNYYTKITIERKMPDEHKPMKISVTIPIWDADLYKIIQEMIRPMLISFGFQETSVDEALGLSESKD